MGVTYITYAMTIRELFAPLGIKDYVEFAKRTGLSKQRAWQVWNGKTGVGGKKALIISSTTGVPVELILAIGTTNTPKRKR